MPPEMVEALKPEYVTPLVAFLCHEETTENGGLYEVGASWVSQVRWQRTRGHVFGTDGLTPEKIKAGWAKVTDWTNATNPTTAGDSTAEIVSALNAKL